MTDPDQIARVLQRLAEQRISEAMEAGAFDNLAGMGRPLADLDEPYDEMWWVRKWLSRERNGDFERQPGDKRYHRIAAVETVRMTERKA
ncbi:MAG TPA: DUF1992 domain-containing protein [Phycisphaerae bacterium]|nr:DUF1992 domain-containing protein [Phycisphaerae bacterium]HOJ74765.1 DUF1992 domain-containing protein [Phycisphaerae bacterium]HOM52134.1 DUF1992 domain-containing protein [Phycisphaerae bacterium]HON66339.1 DUF1992 domain-containing protein [Phycisphaerae bacterium]HOQ85896.1 DUF1992 domain-containing protein [Phycisphaerae bacterium]